MVIIDQNWVDGVDQKQKDLKDWKNECDKNGFNVTWKLGIDRFKSSTENYEKSNDKWKDGIDTWQSETDKWKKKKEKWESNMDSWKSVAHGKIVALEKDKVEKSDYDHDQKDVQIRLNALQIDVNNLKTKTDKTNADVAQAQKQIKDNHASLTNTITSTSKEISKAIEGVQQQLKTLQSKPPKGKTSDESDDKTTTAKKKNDLASWPSIINNNGGNMQLFHAENCHNVGPIFGACPCQSPSTSPPNWPPPPYSPPSYQPVIPFIAYPSSRRRHRSRSRSRSRGQGWEAAGGISIDLTNESGGLFGKKNQNLGIKLGGGGMGGSHRRSRSRARRSTSWS
jgi:hypothetical protein